MHLYACIGLTVPYDTMQAVLQPLLESGVISTGAGRVVPSTQTGNLNIRQSMLADLCPCYPDQ